MISKHSGGGESRPAKTEIGHQCAQRMTDTANEFGALCAARQVVRGSRGSVRPAVTFTQLK